MKHITEVLVYKNRCEVFNQHTYTQGDVGIPHIKLIFKYLFEEQSLQGKQLECKYILPNGEYSVKTVGITEKDCVVFPIHYSVLQIAGWTTLKATLVCDSGRITLDDILIKTKSCKLGQLNTTPQVTQAIKCEIDEIKAFTETKKKEVTNHTTQEITRVTKATDSQIARVVNEGKTQVQVLKNQSNGVIPRIEKLESGKSDLTGSTFTGLVAVKKDTNGEAMVALNSAYGNGDIYSGGSAKGVGFKNRTSGKGLFLGDDGSIKLHIENLNSKIKDVVSNINSNFAQFISNGVTNINDIKYTGVYGCNATCENAPNTYWGTVIYIKPTESNPGRKIWFDSLRSGYIYDKADSADHWEQIWTSETFNPSTKLDKSSVVNDLVSGGADKPLSAEQGKLLKQEIEALKQQIAQLKK